MRTITITLPDDLARSVATEVAAGRYVSETDMAVKAVAALLDDKEPLTPEAWLRDSVVESCREMAANPALAIPIDDVLSRVEARAQQRAANEGR